MKNIQEIRQQLLTGNFEFTRHAFKRSIERKSVKEIQQTELNGEHSSLELSINTQAR